MARMRGTAERVEQLLGRPVVATSPVAGGDICVATRVRLADGSSALVKSRPGAPAGFFEAEARGLRWLAEPGVVPVAEVLAVEADCLVIGWIEPTRPSPEAAADLGRGLARLHAGGAAAYGAEQDGFVGSLPLPNRTAPSWPEFYATRRVLPYLKLAVDRGHVDREDATAVEDVVRRLTSLAGPDEPPARLHGDLWSGNVVWGHDGAVLVDPAAHGGHRETDLAMLALFGLPHLQRLVDAYDEERPLADGWQDRQPLHQLFPVLVHAAMFGSAYGRRAGELARRLR
ncbi:Fructosamine-3-kinase [Nocardioides scoriae]|uniref:Fructosamine-3-kinase n=1 Tax=Nocardioides scoriae TaxID=642780 RepID=A0A1H1WD67_9ACTN|nr:fructosamine kinase family protein [Nocardioides scoriae]SDS94316.1 Fructosamine-3-kinase [Nocardioides scoriae]